MATYALAKLCRVVLKDVYGDLASQVVGVLFDHGRQTARSIASHLDIALSTVYRTIVALLQNRFLLNWTDGNKVYYYANWFQIYGVLWNGTIVATVNEKFDDLTAEVVKNVLVNGNMKAADYLENYENRDYVEELMVKLVEEKILSPVLDYEFHPVEDILSTMVKKHQKVVKSDPKLKSDSARQQAAKAAAEDEKNELLESKDVPKFGLLKTEEASFRQAEKYKLDPEAVLGVNYDKYLVISRNQQLVKLVEERIGPVTAGVYKRVLDVITPKLHRCRQVLQGKEFNVSTREVTSGIDDSLDIEGSISNPMHSKRGPDFSNGGPSTKRLRTENGFVDQDQPQREESLTTKSVAEHLDLLTDSPLKFLVRVSQHEWYVPFDELMPQVRKATYERIIKNRFGSNAVRVLRIIEEKGKVDERQLSSLALLQPTDIRKHVAELQECGALDLQEIPRGNDRAAGRSFYLWFHDPQRAQSHILQDLYTVMHHLYMRLFAERKSCSILLAKLEREDVKANPELYISEQEQKEWTKLRNKEQKLSVQMLRIDDLIKIFRDY